MDAFWAAIGWVLSLPWLKLAYSALLLALASVVLLELGSVWTRQPVMIGGFTYYADGAEDAGRALGLRTQIRHQHSLVSHRLRAEAERRAREAAEVEGGGRGLAARHRLAAGRPLRDRRGGRRPQRTSS